MSTRPEPTRPAAGRVLRLVQRLLPGVAALLLGGGLLGTQALAAADAAPPGASTAAEWRVASTGVRVGSGKSTADHRRFKELQGPFASGEEVTKACLSCHTEASKQLMQTPHWTWDYTNPDTGQRLGKKTMVNAFCIGDRSNEAFCQTCHIGYGWKDADFDFAAETQVDCLVCHNTGDYRKHSGTGGQVLTERLAEIMGTPPEMEPVDLAWVAQRVGKTSTQTCGSCHYYGGGGDGVKHGDLDSSLNTATRALDVHMASKAQGGAGFACATCHQADAHALAGSRISMTAADPHGPALRGADLQGRNAATCQSCHGDKPHKESFLHAQRLNQHTQKLACQACHIPSFARGGVPTKMGWDWSTAGRNTGPGQPVIEKDAQGNVIYDGRKGDFVLGEDVVPDYLWFDGRVEYTTQETRIDPDDIVHINSFLGAANDPQARIWPVKRFHGKQPYDVEGNFLLVPHVSGGDASTALWHSFDWDKALEAGARATEVAYSGQYDFVRSEMLWPITHMVAPKEQAVSCMQCHSAQSRLKDVPGLYLPGHDRHTWIDRIGWLAVLAAALGVLVHAGIRILTHRRS